MSTLKVNSITPVTAGSEDYFLSRAWVNFNGTGTVAIRQDGNVSSITDNGTGNFDINFSSTMTDADYSVNAGAIQDNGSALVAVLRIHRNSTPGTSSVQINTTRAYNDSGSNTDCDITNVSIVR